MLPVVVLSPCLGLRINPSHRAGRRPNRSTGLSVVSGAGEIVVFRCRLGCGVSFRPRASAPRLPAIAADMEADRNRPGGRRENFPRWRA